MNAVAWFSYILIVALSLLLDIMVRANAVTSPGIGPIELLIYLVLYGLLAGVFYLACRHGMRKALLVGAVVAMLPFLVSSTPAIAFVFNLALYSSIVMGVLWVWRKLVRRSA